MKHKPIKILLFFTYGVSLNRWNGTGLIGREVLYYQELARKHNVKVTFLTYGQSKDVELAKKYIDIDIVPVYNKIRKPKYRIFRFIQSLFIPFIFRETIKKADILKTNQIWGSWVAVLSKIIYKKTLIIRCGWEKYFYNLSGMDHSNRFFVRLVSLISYRIADHIIISSEDSKSFIVNTFKIKRKKISFFPNWIDTSTFSPTKKENKILFVGRLVKEKNPLFLVDTLKNTDLEIDMVGHGYLEKDLIQKIKESGSKIKFLGKIPNDKMPNLYRKYSMYIICSDIEGNPKTLLEAMSSSCAVVGTNVPGIKNVIDHLKTGVLVNKDEESLRKALLDLSANEKLRIQLGKNARKQIIKNNSLEIILEKESFLYKKLLKN